MKLMKDDKLNERELNKENNQNICHEKKINMMYIRKEQSYLKNVINRDCFIKRPKIVPLIEKQIIQKDYLIKKI
jgi:hypothetical protein